MTGPEPSAAERRSPGTPLVTDRFALEARDVHHAYGAVRALRGVSLRVKPGEIQGLVGANGAGKSTLIRILTGDLRPDGGEVLVDGQSVELRTVRDAQSLGIGVVRQELDLVPDLTVAENLFLGEEQRYSSARWRLDRARSMRPRDRCSRRWASRSIHARGCRRSRSVIDSSSLRHVPCATRRS